LGGGAAVGVNAGVRAIFVKSAVSTVYPVPSISTSSVAMGCAQLVKAIRPVAIMNLIGLFMTEEYPAPPRSASAVRLREGLLRHVKSIVFRCLRRTPLRPCHRANC